MMKAITSLVKFTAFILLLITALLINNYYTYGYGSMTDAERAEMKEIRAIANNQCSFERKLARIKNQGDTFSYFDCMDYQKIFVKNVGHADKTQLESWRWN